VPLESTVHVIATSPEGTRAALDVATALARSVSGRVALFIRRGAADRTSDGLRRLTESCTPRPNVFTCVCEKTTDVVQLFQSPGLVVIGGHTRTWWPTAEQRLARDLARLGCHVMFVHVPHRQFVSPLVAAAREGSMGR
jgi:hypothetical protein